MEEISLRKVNGAFLFISTHRPRPAARDEQCVKGSALETRSSGTRRPCCGFGVPSRPRGPLPGRHRKAAAAGVSSRPSR